MHAWVLAAMLASSPSTAMAALPIESPAQVMTLSPEIRARLKSDVLDKASSQRDRLNRLLHLFFDPDGLNLTYRDDATLPVSQAYASRSVNCLSFSMLFTAMAREAGLDAQPQEIRKTLAWHQDSGILYRVDHVNTVVNVHGVRYLVDILGGSVIHLEKPELISDKRLLAHYYNNLAMQDLENGELAAAARTMKEALALDPDDANNWSNAGVLSVHEGDTTSARTNYEKALSIEPTNISALANMAALAEQQGDKSRAKALRDRLEELQQSDPLYHFLQAELDEQSGNYAQAIDHYRKAIRLHGDESRFHDALARAYLKSGDRESAIRSLRRAMRLSSGVERDGYRKRVEALQGT